MIVCYIVFYTELHRVSFEVYCVERVAQSVLLFFGTRIKRVRLGGTLIVTDFFLKPIGTIDLLRGDF